MNKSDSVYIGIDTSCYTTSVAAVDSKGIIIADNRRLLTVPSGMNGLQQSNGFFQHVKQLPDLYRQLVFDCKKSLSTDKINIRCVSVSVKPRDNEGSYMPVFLAGKAFASIIATDYNCCLFETNHQAGHLRAALYGHQTLSTDHLYAIHLSGGTTELLKIEHDFKSNICGCTIDSSAGQIVDRIGVRLGCSFPSGKELEKMAVACKGVSETDMNRIPVYVNKDLKVSFSGPMSALMREIDKGTEKQTVALMTYSVIARTLVKWMALVRESDVNAEFLLMGGVASSFLLRQMISSRMLKLRMNFSVYYSDSALSSDNACGIALIGKERMEKL